MKPFTVLLQRSSLDEARVNLEAADEAEAKELAEQRAEDGMVAWVRVNAETSVEVEDR